MSVFAELLGATPQLVVDTLGKGEGSVYALDASQAMQVQGVTGLVQTLGDTSSEILNQAHFELQNSGTSAVAKALRSLAQLVLRVP